MEFSRLGRLSFCCVFLLIFLGITVSPFRGQSIDRIQMEPDPSDTSMELPDESTSESLQSNQNDTSLQKPDLGEEIILKAEVIAIKGRVAIRKNRERGWESVTKGDTLTTGYEVKTSKSGTVTLKIPGLAVISLDTGTHLDFETLRRKKKLDEGILSDEEVTKNELDVNLHKGEIMNSLRDRANMETDYKVETPNAVAGIRGTTVLVEVKEQKNKKKLRKENINDN